MDLINLQFTSEQLGVLNQLLVKAPYELAAPMIASINNQLQRKQPPAPDKTSARPPKGNKGNGSVSPLHPGQPAA